MSKKNKTPKKHTKKKFTPTIRTEKKLDLKGFHKLDKLKDKDGKIITKLNQSTVVQALSQKLYRNAESGFRELLNNEIRACQIAKDKYGSKNPHITVSLDTSNRSLTIHGINSQGITTEVLNVLREIGQSITESKKGGRIPFGMGFYGSLKLSDVVQVHTRCIENGESYGVQLKGGLFFEEIQDADFKETGTRIKVTLKPKTNYEKIIDTLIEVSKTSGVKTYLNLKAHNGDISGKETGIYELERTSIRKIFDATKRSEYSYLTASINNNEVEAYLSIAIGSSGSLYNERKKELFLVNSPIEAILDEQDYDDYDYEAENNDDDDDDDDYNYDNDNEDEKKRIKYKASKIDEINYYSVVVNMKKESIFPAMQDRERLDPKAEKKLREVIVQLYNDALKSIKPCHKIEDWFDHEHKFFISSSKKDLIDLEQTLDEKTKKLRTLLNTEVFPYMEENKSVQLGELKYLLDNYYKDKKDIKLFYALKKDKRVLKILVDNYGYEQEYTGFFFCLLDIRKIENQLVDDGVKNVVNTALKKFNATKNILEHYGFVNAKDHIKEHGLKRIVEEVEEEEEEEEDTGIYVTIHGSSLEKQSEQIDVLTHDFDIIKKGLVKVNDYKKYNKIINEFGNDELFLVIDDPKIEQLNDVQNIKNIYDKIKNKKYLTNFGKISVQEILQLFKKSTDIIINEDIDESDYGMLVHVPKISDRDKRVSQLYIVGDEGKEIFKLALVLIHNNRNYELIEEDDHLDSYYRNSLSEIADNLEELIGYTQHNRYSNNRNTIDEDSFDTLDKPIEEFEKYLNSIKEINEKVKNITLRQLFQKGHHEENYKKIIEDVLKLNKQIETTKIKRKEKNYL